MKYFSFTYVGEKGNVDVYIAADGIVSAYNAAINYVEDMLIPRLGPSEEEISVFAVTNDEYWYHYHRKSDLSDRKPHFIAA